MDDTMHYQLSISDDKPSTAVSVFTKPTANLWISSKGIKQ